MLPPHGMMESSESDRRLCYFSATWRAWAKETVSMSGNQRERMSSVDTAWLRMDRPSNLMMICGVLILSERVTLARLKSTISQRFLRFRRFRQRAVQTPAGAFWETDASFDIARHVLRAKLSARASKEDL